MDAMATARTGEWRGGYELLDVIESSSGCDIYLATDRATGQMVEIRVPSDGSLSTPKVVQQLVRDANLLRALNLPALASVIALDADAEGIPFVVEEHVRGPSARKLIAASACGMPLERVLHAIIPIVEAVARCHQVGVIHGRIDRDHVVMTDGSQAPPAKLVRAGARYDSPPSRLAPELQTDNDVPDARTDVWGIAALMHEMLLGTPPSAGLEGVRVAPDADRLPAQLAALLEVCLAVSPKARPQDATMLCDVLRRLRDPRGSSATAARPKAAPPQAPESAMPALSVDAPRRRRRRRREPLTDAELGVRAERSRRVRAAATVMGYSSATSRAVHFVPAPEAGSAPAPLGAAQPPTIAEPHLVAPPAPALREQQRAEATAAGERGSAAEPASYRLPEKSLLGLSVETARDTAEAASVARQPHPAPAREFGAVAPTAASAPATPAQQAPPNGEASPLRIDGARKAGALRAKPRGTAPRVRAKSVPVLALQRAARGGIAQGGATPRQVLRSVRAAEKAARSRSRAQDIVVSSARVPLGDLEPRLRIGERPRSAIEAVRRVGERDAQRKLTIELFVMILCTWLFFGVPLLCDPSHAHAQHVFGARVRLGVVSVAASAVVALLQLWWLQLTTREAALWPATTAFKGLTLLVCFLAATYFVPIGLFGRLETTACALLPWAAGAFYLCLGVYGLSRTRYNTAQNAPLGVALALLYGGSAVGLYRVVSASAIAKDAASSSQAQKLHELNSAVQRYAHERQPSPQFGRNEKTLEAELEALGDTTGKAEAGEGGNAQRTRDGSDKDALQNSDQLRETRKQRAAQLEALHKKLEAIKRR